MAASIVAGVTATTTPVDASIPEASGAPATDVHADTDSGAVVVHVSATPAIAASEAGPFSQHAELNAAHAALLDSFHLAPFAPRSADPPAADDNSDDNSEDNRRSSASQRLDANAYVGEPSEVETTPSLPYPPPQPAYPPPQPACTPSPAASSASATAAESPYALPTGLIAAGLAAQAKYSAAFGSKVHHSILPMDPARAGRTADGRMPSYARPTIARPYPEWHDDELGADEVAANAVAASYGCGATGSGAAGSAASVAAGATAARSTRASSHLGRAPRESYHGPGRYVGVAHARISTMRPGGALEPHVRVSREGSALEDAYASEAAGISSKRTTQTRYALSAAAKAAAARSLGGGAPRAAAGGVPPRSELSASFIKGSTP